MNRELLEARLAELPLYVYADVDPAELEFAERIRWICENECPMCNQTWADIVEGCEKIMEEFA